MTWIILSILLSILKSYYLISLINKFNQYITITIPYLLINMNLLLFSFISRLEILTIKYHLTSNMQHCISLLYPSNSLKRRRELRVIFVEFTSVVRVIGPLTVLSWNISWPEFRHCTKSAHSISTSLMVNPWKCVTWVCSKHTIHATWSRMWIKERKKNKSTDRLIVLNRR